MKYTFLLDRYFPTNGRTPHGVRGLKWHVHAGVGVELAVAPHTGCVD